MNEFLRCSSSFFLLQTDYQPKSMPIIQMTMPVEDDDFIPPEPPPRTDYGKKALVGSLMKIHSSIGFLLGVGRQKLSPT